MKRFWLDTIIMRPWLTLLIGMVLIVAAAAGGKNLYFRGDYKIFFEKENEQLVGFEEMQRVFTKNETASIVIAPHSGDVFNKETLTLIKEITDEAWQIPYSSRVDSIANHQHTWAEEDDLIVEDLILEVDMIDEETIARAKSVALTEPNLVKRMISDKGHVAVVHITVQLADNEVQAFTQIARAVKAMSDQFKEKYPAHDFYHTGIVFMNDSFATEAQNDSQTLVPGMFLAIVVVLWMMLRSFTGTFATVVVIITSIAATMGLSGWMGFFLSTATVNVPTMVMTLAVADCVHVISSMLFGLKQGKSKDDAIRYAMQLNLMPIFITSVTTAIGFLTMNFSDVPVLADLGNLTALGVMLAFVFSITLLPALLKIMPMRTSKVAETKREGMEKFGEWVINNHKKLLPISVVVVAVFSSFIFFNQVNDVATEYFDDRTEFRRSTNFQQENVSGMSTINFALYSGEESGLNKPKMLNLVDSFSDWLRQQPEVDHVSTISDTFKRLNKNMHGDDENYYRLPQDQELAAQYLLLYEMSLPYGLDLNNQINLDKSATRILATMKNLGSKEFTEFEIRSKKWFEENAPQIDMKAASPNLMFAHIGERNMVSMIRGTLIALVLISGLLVFALKSWRLGGISLLPNLLPAALGFGIWGAYSGEINMGLSVVLSMALGIIVDDTVHFLSKYKHARMEGRDATEGVRYAFSSVGRALLITTIVLTIGFGILAMSAFRLNSDMGLLTGIIIVSALVVDFFFLPAFLMVFDKKKFVNEDKSDENITAQTA